MRGSTITVDIKFIVFTASKPVRQVEFRLQLEGYNVTTLGEKVLIEFSSFCELDKIHEVVVDLVSNPDDTILWYGESREDILAAIQEEAMLHEEISDVHDSILGQVPRAVVP